MPEPIVPPDLMVLRVLAATLDDLERTRIMTSNRIGAAERAHGDSLPHLHRAPRVGSGHRAPVRPHPRPRLAPALAGSLGRGDPMASAKQLISRLFAITGEPSLRPVGHWAQGAAGRREWALEGYAERSAAELLAYCGNGDPTRNLRRPEMTRGRSCSGRATPRPRRPPGSSATSSCARPPSPYRAVYLTERGRYVDKRHARWLRPLWSPGRPAPPGSPWSENHKHHAAIRNTTHVFLVDLWRESRPPPEASSTTSKRGQRGGRAKVVASSRAGQG